MSRPLILVLASLTAISACAPGLPKGVSDVRLEAALDDKVGDPNTCVLIGKAGSGKVVYRYGTHVICGKAWPSCLGSSLTQPQAQLDLVAKSKSPVNFSCPTMGDRSRSVAWAAGPIEGHPDLVYAAVMEGSTVPPGMVVAEHVTSALRSAGF